MSEIIKKEALNLLLAVIPFVLLFILWDKLPEVVPTHFNVEGDADGFSKKTSLIWTVSAMVIFFYFLMSIIPYIDPKKNTEKMGNKYNTLKTIVLGFISGLSCLIIYSAYSSEIMNGNLVLMLLCLILIIFGNFFKTIKPNYFLGIRTPWTLESVEVWKKTHILGGKLFFIGGIILFLLGFIELLIYILFNL